MMGITRDFHFYGRMELQFQLVQLTKNQLLGGLGNESKEWYYVHDKISNSLQPC